MFPTRVIKPSLSERLSKLIKISLIVAGLYMLLDTLTPYIAKNIIQKLQDFYSQDLSIISKYSPLYTEYKIPLSNLSYSLCLLLSEDAPFLEYLNKTAKKHAILHICSQKLYDYVQLALEDPYVQEILENKTKEDIKQAIRTCLLYVIKEKKEEVINGDIYPFEICLLDYFSK